jgi:hypothetical protein
MLCLSLNGTSLNAVGGAMRLTRPQVFAFSLSSAVLASQPLLHSVVTAGTYVRRAGEHAAAVTSVALICEGDGNLNVRVRAGDAGCVPVTRSPIPCPQLHLIFR